MHLPHMAVDCLCGRKDWSMWTPAALRRGRAPQRWSKSWRGVARVTSAVAIKQVQAQNADALRLIPSLLPLLPAPESSYSARIS